MKKLFKIAGSVVLAAAVLTGTKSVWMEKGIFLSFNQEADTDIQYQVFYVLNADDNFSRQNLLTHQASASDSEIKIRIPETHVAKFRLDQGVKPGKVSISNLKISGNTTVEINDFDNFFYSSSIEDKTVEGNKITITSNQNDPYMTYRSSFDVSEGTFIDWTKAGLIGILSFLFGFILLGRFAKKGKRK